MSATLERSGSGAPGLSEHLSNEIGSLEQETDPDLKREGRLHLAGRLEERHPELAAQLYAEIAREPFQDSIAQKAKDRLSTLEGHGPFGLQVERLLRQCSREAFNPKFIVPMMAGSLAFSLSRAWIGARLAGAGWGLGGRALAYGGGFGAELSSFFLLQRQMQGGTNSWGEDLGRTAISLGLLKLSSLALQAPLSRLPGRAAFAPALGGLSLFAANGMEQRLGLRPKTDAALALTESFANYFSLALGARLGRSFLGERFQRWETGLAWQAEGRLQAPQLHPSFEVIGSPLMASAISTPKGSPDPIQMNSHGSGDGKPPVIKTQQRSIPPAQVRQLSAEKHSLFMNPKLEPPSRWEALEQYRQLHPQMTDTKAFTEQQKDLLRLVANPGIRTQILKGKVASEAVAYYGYQHRLRSSAAELYVQGLERSSFGDPLVERGAQILRKVLEDPKIGRAYRPDPRDTEALDYYQRTEVASRARILPLYTRLLFRLAKGSPEARKGIELLSRADWLHRLDSSTPEAGERHAIPALVARAYAYLLDAASPSQLAATQETRGHLLQWLPYLETQARHGDREALRALLMAARHEKPAELAVEALQQGELNLRSDIADYKLVLSQRDQRRIEDFKGQPEPSDSAKVWAKLAYYFREWFWFWH